MNPTRKQRLARGHTRDPWPCCNEPADEQSGRRKGGICTKCAELIQLGKDTLRRQAEAGERTYYWAQHAHWWPQYYGPYDFTDDRLRRRLSEAMFGLVNQATSRITDQHWRRTDEHPVLDANHRPAEYAHCGTVLVSADPKTRDALNDLDAGIREALTSAYRDGEAKGQRSLLQLAGGTLSLADFEKETIDRTR